VHLLKLEPTYAALADGHSDDLASDKQLIAPPLQELQLLHRLAQEGDMRQIIRWAERVTPVDEHYLARQYQSRAVLNLIEQHLHSDN